MKFLTKKESQKKQDLEKSLKEQQKELQEIKAKEEAAKKQAEKEAREKRLAEKKQKYKNQQFWLDKPPSERLIKFILDMSKSNNPVKWFVDHYQKWDSYNLKQPLKKLDEGG